MSAIFKHLGQGEFPSSSEYNRLVDIVTGLLRSSNMQYFQDSTGVHVRGLPASGGGEARTAYCTIDAPDADEIDCYLDTDETGNVITVKAYITSGVSLMFALPFLKTHQPILVTKVGEEWICTSLFTDSRFMSLGI